MRGLKPSELRANEFQRLIALGKKKQQDKQKISAQCVRVATAFLFALVCEDGTV